MATADEDVNSKSDASTREALQETALDEGYPSFFPDEKSYDDWEREFLRYLSFDVDPSEDRDWFIRAGFRESTLDTFIARTNGDTAKIELNISPEGFRGVSTDDPDELRRISSSVRSDLWWAEQECVRLKRRIDRLHRWYPMLLLIFIICLLPVIFIDWVAPFLCYFPSFILLFIVVGVFFLLGAGLPEKREMLKARQAGVKGLKAELEFVQDKIKKIENARKGDDPTTS